MRNSMDPLQRLGEWMTKLDRRLKTLETAPRLQNSSISKGALRILSPEGLIVGGDGTPGSARVYGQLIGDGTLQWDGPWHLDGNGDITGNVEISGDVDLTGDMNVTGGGNITAGLVQIDPSTSGGQIKIGAHRLYVNGAVLTLLHSSGAQLVLNDSGASLTYPGGVLTVDAGGVYASLNTIPLAEAPSGAFVGAVVSIAGYLRRVV